ncbi:MAG: hypothetical protein IPJ98_15255 [Bryobacterales bacterium]|nr:hypothetical protein [Bryobacterales bacterium]
MPVQHVFDVGEVRLHSGEASFNTDSRIKGLNDRLVTTCTRRPNIPLPNPPPARPETKGS